MAAEFYEIVLPITDCQQLKKLNLLVKISSLIKILSFVFLFFLLKSYLFVIGFVVMFLVGIALRQLSLEQTAYYTLTFAGEELIASKTNNLNNQKQLLRLNFDEITEFVGQIDENDILAEQTVMFATDLKSSSAVRFLREGKDGLLLFCPDRYMTALIKNKLQQKIEKEI